MTYYDEIKQIFSFEIISETLNVDFVPILWWIATFHISPPI